jgi:predicted MPP superfamily phosphohydrolase
MSGLDKLAFSFLSDLHSDNVKETFESLSNMVEALENKNDPDPIELEITDVSYQLVEKLNLLAELLKKYVIENDVLLGDKIQSLRDDQRVTLFE